MPIQESARFRRSSWPSAARITPRSGLLRFSCAYVRTLRAKQQLLWCRWCDAQSFVQSRGQCAALLDVDPCPDDISIWAMICIGQRQLSLTMLTSTSLKLNLLLRSWRKTNRKRSTERLHRRSGNYRSLLQREMQ